VHGEVRCRARISLILDLAKWQHGEGFDLVIIWIIGGLFAKDAPLTFRSEKNSLFSVNRFSSPHLNPRSSLNSLSTHPHTLSLSLSLLHPPAEARGRHHSRAPPQPRSTRGGDAQPRGGRRTAARGRRQAARGLVGGGNTWLARRRGRIQIWGEFL